MRLSQASFPSIVLALAISLLLLPQASAKAVAVPGEPPAIAAAAAAPHITAAVAAEEVLEARAEHHKRHAHAKPTSNLKRGYQYGSYDGYYSHYHYHPTPKWHPHHHHHHPVIVVTRTVCPHCVEPWTSVYTTTWCPSTTYWHSSWAPTPTYGYYGGGWGYYGPTTVVHKTVYTQVTRTIVAGAVTSPAGAICSTIYAQGPGLPITTQGACGLIVIANGAAGLRSKKTGSLVVSAGEAGLVGGMIATWALAVMGARLAFGG